MSKKISPPKLFRPLRRDSILRRLLAVVVLCNFSWDALANPTGMTVQHGNATLSINGSTLSVSVGNNAVLNWRTFNIGNGETTIFNQPSASSIVWNRINDQNPSQIYGSLHANGVVVLLNSSGFYFGPNSFVSAAGLVVSTANCMPPDNGVGSWVFNGPPPLASIVNYGKVKIGNGGDCFFIADKIENHGSVEAPGGNIAFAAGQTVTLSERPDGRGMSMQVTLPKGSVDNYGNVIADGGTIALHAKVVNQAGLLQANSVREQNGVIELIASDSVNLGADSRILAQGDDSIAGSAGGVVTIKADNNFSDVGGSKIVTAGGANGGNGGNVEISAANIQSLETAMDASARGGWIGGEFLLDPVNIVLGTSGAGVVPGSGTVPYNTSGNLSLNVNTAFLNKNFSNIKLQASQNITIAAGTTWDLGASTGVGSGQLTLQAGNNITFATGTSIVDSGGWSLSLAAGYDFINNVIKQNTGSIFLNGGSNLTGSGTIQLNGGSVDLRAGSSIQIGSGSVTTGGGNVVWRTGGDITFMSNGSQISVGDAGNVTLAAGYNFAADSIVSGKGNIFLNGGTGKNNSGTVQTYSGAVDLEAGSSVLVGSGAVRTTGGGSILVNALAGTVNTGTLGKGYNFLDAKNPAGAPIYSVDPSLGGISTANGGNVTINAGLDVISQLPAGTLTRGGAGCGAFGSAPGDVTINAGRDVIGHYVVANGTGKINAGNNAGGASDTTVLALSLINGGWTVNAVNDINLSEVRNPNGIFNKNGNLYGPNYQYLDYHFFDYGLADYVSLNAGNSIVLGNGNRPRYGSDFEKSIPVIYPGKLDMVAGAGGITLASDLTLFPSPQGGLTIQTAGSISGTSGDLTSIVVSDSGKNQYQSGAFGQSDHAQIPVHLNNPTPITVSVAGDMSNIQLVAPEAAQINVGGNMVNSRFLGQNLHAGDVTSITVGGDIRNRNEFTITTIDYAPQLDLLQQAYAPSSVAGDFYRALANQLHYDPKTGKLTFQGRMNNEQLQALLNLPIQKVDSHGTPVVDVNGNPVLKYVQILDPTTANYLFSSSQDIPDGGINSGYVIGGGGSFNINARNIDLGTTKGVQSVGPLNNESLARYFNHGATINVNASQNLDMFSAAICSFNSGNVNVFCGGDMNVGSLDFTGNDALARGIFTAGKADVSVVANGNINVNGSRIAAYDGGNVTVISLNGDINAGGGGLGFVRVDNVTVSGQPDPLTGKLYTEDLETIPGSGIITTTFPTSQHLIGNILVETPHGNVLANSGGIIQLPLNSAVKSPNAAVTVLAGYQLRDANGNPLSAADLGRSAIQASLGSASSGDAPQTVVVGGQRIPVSDAVWSQLQSVFGLTPASGQVMECHVTGDSADFVSWLQGGAAGLAQYAFTGQTADNKNIDASGSGVIGNNVNLQASGNILGVIFARDNVNLSAQQNANVTVLAQGNVTANAGGTLSGTLIGVSGVSASGGSIDATVLSQNASVNGSSSGDTFAQGTAANSTSQGLSAESNPNQSSQAANEDTDELKKKKGGIGLAQKVSRVTVVLPGKKPTASVAAGQKL